jgi:hypothetical protein
MLKSVLTCVLACVLAAGAAGCSSSSTGSDGSSGSSGATTNPTGGTTYKGTFTGKGNDGGSIDVTVASATTAAKDLHPLTVLQVSGTVKPSGGAAVAVTGTFDDATKQLTITGGGYSFTGTATSDGVTGTYTGPKGTGNFSVLTGSSATPYCGTFAGDASGIWNFVVNGSSLSGSAIDSQGNGDTLTGSVTGGSVSITTKNGSTATGSISGTTANGTYANGAVKGTWTGTAGCGG